MHAIAFFNDFQSFFGEKLSLITWIYHLTLFTYPFLIICLHMCLQKTYRKNYAWKLVWILVSRMCRPTVDHTYLDLGLIFPPRFQSYEMDVDICDSLQPFFIHDQRKLARNATSARAHTGYTWATTCSVLTSTLASAGRVQMFVSLYGNQAYRHERAQSLLLLEAWTRISGQLYLELPWCNA